MAFNDVVLNISAKDIEEVALYGVKTKEQSFGREMQEQARRNINAMVLFELFDGGALSFEETESGKILKINVSQGLTIDNYGNLCVDFSQLPSSSNLNLVAHMPLEILESEDEYGNIVKNLNLSTDMSDVGENTLDLDAYNRLKVNTDVIATKEYVDEVATGGVDLSGYQEKLVAGDGIDITNNVVSFKTNGNGLNFDSKTGKFEVSIDDTLKFVDYKPGTKKISVDTEKIATKEDVTQLRDAIDNVSQGVGNVLNDKANKSDLDDLATKEELNAKADKEKKLELIETVIVENEETPQVVFSNNIAKYKHFYLYVEIPASSGSGAVTSLMTFTSGYSLTNAYVASAITNAKRYYHLRADKTNGYWNVRFGLATAKGQDSTVTLKHALNGAVFSDTKYQGDLSKISFGGQSGVYLPIDTKIELRGAE